MILAVGAVAVGFMSLEIGGFEGFASFLTQGEHGFELNPGVTLISIAIAAGGFGLGYAVYMRHSISSESLALKYGTLNRILVNKLYMDDAYQWGIDRVALAFSGTLAWFDRVVVNDTAVNGTADTIRNAGYRIRYLESGLLYNYALGMALGVVAVALFWWLVIPRIV
jgi:NADH-quinone oxidoreductase subunit L